MNYRFNRVGVVQVEKADGVSEDDVLIAVLDAGAEEVNDAGDTFEVTCEASDLVDVRSAIQDAGLEYESAETEFRADVKVPLDLDGAKK